MTSTLVKKPAFWIALLVASGLCVFLVLRFFGEAFSVLDLDVRMSRTMAIDEAKRLNRSFGLSDAPLAEAAATFADNAEVQTFVELEGGGKPALKPLLGGDEFTLYRWYVRLFSPGVEREVHVAFTPDGQPEGFVSKLPEAAPGAALSADAARAIAVATATRDWHVDFDRYRALTASATTQPRGRVDHEFVYERKLDGAPSIGDGRLRLRLMVSGDRLTQLQRFVYVPEAFKRRYKTMRTANDNIAQAASVVAGLVYGLGGCLIGLVWLMRRRAVRWAPSAKWAALVGLLIGAAALAAIPGSWINYDTATSASTHRITAVVGALVAGVVTWLLLTVVFATAEGMGRLAFGDHPQLWRSWLRPAANSRAIWGRTLAGYAWIGFDLAFIAIFYFVVQRELGWWSPSDSLVDPNILGTPQPWLGPVSMALQAGMMEESLFRAIPLAGAALLGRRFGRERLFVGIALVLQAIVFGCAHANYPGQPAYARPVELFFPALVWGVVYLRYGLIPGMLFHFGFDLVLMSIPLFVTAAPGIGFDRVMVIGALAVPLVVLTIQRLRAGRLIDLPDSERNAATGPVPGATPPAEAAVLETVDAVEANMTGAASAGMPADAGSSSAGALATAPRRVHLAILAACAVIGLIGIGIRLATPFDAPRLAIDRARALAIADQALASRRVVLDARWRRSALAVTTSDPSGERFVWREGGRAAFERLMGRSIAPPHWEVRYARFDGDVGERDAWRVVVVDDRPAPDGVRLVEHDIPEARAGKRLTEAEARPIADAAIASWLHRPASALRAVTAHATEQPARIDWLFVYADPAIALPAGGEARIAAEIDGDEVAVVGRSVFVPDAWEREERARGDAVRIARIALAIVALALSVAVVIVLVRRLARGEASMRAAWVVAALMIVVVVGGALLDREAIEFGFTVAEPFGAQVVRTLLSWGGIAAAGALFGALVTMVGVRIARRAEAQRPGRVPGLPAWRTWLAPLSLGLLAAGAGAIGGGLGMASAPRIPTVGAASSLVPTLTAFLGAFGLPIAISMTLIVVASIEARRRWVDSTLPFAFVLVAMLGRAAAPDPTLAACAAAGLAGAAAWAIYRTQVRHRLWVIAPTFLCLALINQLVALVRPTYPGAVAAAAAAIVATLIAYRLWRWLVTDDRGPVRR